MHHNDLYEAARLSPALLSQDRRHHTPRYVHFRFYPSRIFCCPGHQTHSFPQRFQQGRQWLQKFPRFDNQSAAEGLRLKSKTATLINNNRTTVLLNFLALMLLHITQFVLNTLVSSFELMHKFF